MLPEARFDDLTPRAERSFVLRGLQEVVVAREVEDVAAALQRVEYLTGRGLWAGGFVAYEAAPGLDPGLAVRPRLLTDPFVHLPLVWFGLFLRREQVAPMSARSVHPAPYHVSAWTPEVSRDHYERAIANIREHIADGDSYQVNHTFRLRAAFSGDPVELYRDMVLSQRGSHGSFFDTGRHRILSASPEQFFRLEDGVLSVRPMKGTSRRGRWLEEDEELSAAMLASEKERAENLMIVDLLRNDLGRVAEFGTVEVNELFALERYETLWQLTSHITAEVRPGTDVLDTFRALFPSGSVTGAPKARTMEIIADLETSPRGVYCGAVGYVAPPGAPGPRCEFSVGIRTVVVDIDEGVAEYGIGGGITWDSVTSLEYEEARLKAALLVERRPDFELLETLRWEPEQGFWWLEEHLERLASSARYFGFLFDDGEARQALAAAVLDEARPRVVRLLLARHGGVVVTVAEGELPAFDALPPSGVLRLMVSNEPVSSQNVFLFHKTSRRRTYQQQLGHFPDADDVVLVNERGHVTETTTCNVVARHGPQWWTPPLDSGLLCGVYRSVLLDKGTIAERVLTVDDLRTADEIAVVNSVRGWRPAVLAG